MDGTTQAPIASRSSTPPPLAISFTLTRRIPRHVKVFLPLFQVLTPFVRVSLLFSPLSLPLDGDGGVLCFLRFSASGAAIAIRIVKGSRGGALYATTQPIIMILKENGRGGGDITVMGRRLKEGEPIGSTLRLHSDLLSSPRFRYR